MLTYVPIRKAAKEAVTRFSSTPWANGRSAVGTKDMVGEGNAHPHPCSPVTLGPQRTRQWIGQRRLTGSRGRDLPAEAIRFLANALFEKTEIRAHPPPARALELASIRSTACARTICVCSRPLRA